MNAPALRDQSDIAALVDRARKLFDDGDVIKARKVAARAYDQAAADVRFAEDVQASEQLMDKARRLQADALLIEHRCKIAIADFWDAAQATGEASKGGRPKKTVSDENGFSAENVGLTRGEIHEARKLRDAERASPGLVERAIQARVEAGLAPTKAAVKAAIGTRTATKEERGDNLYETPEEGIRLLICREQFAAHVVEPFCGRGAISRPMEAAGYALHLSDLNDYGTATADGELQHVQDFLQLSRETVLGWTGGEDFDLVSNPPYGELVDACISHALKVIRPRKMALLLNLNWLCGYTDKDREYALEQAVPSRIIINKHRLPMMHRDGWEGDKASSQMNTMWVIWERDENGNYAGNATMQRADYADYVSAPVLGPDGAERPAPDLSPVDEFQRETVRRTLEERVEDALVEAAEFCAGRASVSLQSLRQGLGLRASTAEAVFARLKADGVIAGEANEEGWHDVLPMVAG